MKSALRGKRVIVVIVLLIISYISVVTAYDKSFIGKQAKEFVLEDQFSKEHTWSKFNGKPVILLLSDREGSKYSDNWSKPLFEKFGKNVEFIAIADVSSVPFFLKGFIRGKFREAYKNPVLLDWDGDIVEYYGITENVTTFIAINKNGIVQSYLSGKGSPDELTKAEAAIQTIIR